MGKWLCFVLLVRKRVSICLLTGRRNIQSEGHVLPLMASSYEQNRNEIMRSVVVDGNFKADHVRQKQPEDDVWLTSGEGIYAERTRYLEHLALAKETKEASPYAHYAPATLIAAVRRMPAIVLFEH